MKTAQTIQTERSSSRPRTGAAAGRAPALVTDGLTKRYGGRVAVDSLSLEVLAGVVAGFIGPNGGGQ